MISIIPLSLRFKFGSVPPPVPSGTSKVTKKSHWARCLFHVYRLLLCCKKFNSHLRGRKTALVDTFSHSACVWVAFSTTFTVVGLATWASKRNTAAAINIVLRRKQHQLINPPVTKIYLLSVNKSRALRAAKIVRIVNVQIAANGYFERSWKPRVALKIMPR